MNRPHEDETQNTDIGGIMITIKRRRAEKFRESPIEVEKIRRSKYQKASDKAEEWTINSKIKS